MRIPINHAIRLTKGKVYFFNGDGIYQALEIKDAIKANIGNIWINHKGRYVLAGSSLHIGNITLEKKVITLLEEGDYVERLLELLETIELEKRVKPTGLDRFITKICRPKFERVPENKKAHTFDYIFIDVAIVKEWEEDKKEYIRRHWDEILQRVMQTLQKNRKFQSFGVPVNFLKISRITLRKDDIIEFVFELKSV